ncbi:NAD(P)-dependent oxidoreductase [Sphingoaurantiacus capsulatus]|uniref:precorrin-2 dehydrogenase n=1 Tax=Sphingoaurantiacus capsulatus TaxID=1771310 RepID=A0ABV7XDY1_9SPHN
MDRLPLFIDLAGREVVLLGTGPAADAKRRLIEAAGGRVTTDPSSAQLAFVSLTGDAAEAAASDLKRQGLLVNVVDRPDLCDFLIPAIVDRSPVIVAIGTGGASATLAKALRERLEALLPASLGDLARRIGARRRGLAEHLPTPEQRRRFWDDLMTPGAPLDPLAPVGDPDAAIDAALAGDAEAVPSLVSIALTSDDPDDLTLRQLRALSRADTVFHANAPAAILDRARRDAVREKVTTLPEALPAGLSVFLYRIDRA